jgi:molecular chaperone DnaK (HSP70)
MSDIIGIDLGTTNSMAALASGDKAEIIENEEFSSWQTSVVFHTNENFVVGKEAEAYKVLEPQNCFFSFKPLMGKKYKDFQEKKDTFSYKISEGEQGEVLLGEKKFHPEQLSAEVLKKVKKICEIILKKEVKKVVITTPAYFDDVQRKATKQAAEIANLQVVRIINEPTAAAIAYGLDQKTQGKVAIFDFGGGTFDISILEFKNKIFRVLATHGNTQLGGNDLDELLAAFILKKYGYSKAKSKELQNYILQVATNAKIHLSNHLVYESEILLDGEKKAFRITRAKWNEIILPLVEKTIEHTKIALKDAGLNASQISDIVLVGGSTRVALVREKVTEFFSKKPHLKIDPDKVVAIGAAVQGQLLAGERKDFLLVDVIPLSLGIETLNGVFSKLILRNSSIPCKTKETFSTQKDGQSKVAINIYQGERELVQDCRFLGQLILGGIPAMPAGLARIEVEFLVDTNGLLRVSAKELRSGIAAEIEIIPDQGLKKEQIDKMVEDSIIYAEDDFLQSRLQEFCFQAKTMLDALEKSWDLAIKYFSEKEQEEVLLQKETLQKAITGKDALAIKKASDDLGKLTTEFANYVMEQKLKNAGAAIKE